ncbi:hypothetical protein P7M11_02075 [Bisgaard Taxon 10/6]|uniref:hypothetical protein n=1 Tax=Exercitatus varius TaxID=67857 RepID=UPI00294B6171|nr:hypothetical protein [Exercitatus varius]MDG2953513.1 hypothetical protein [Exercitatus varius]
MANIILKDITPVHFFNAVKLLKSDDYSIYCTLDSIEIRFNAKQFLTKQESDERFEFCEHLAIFLAELKNSDIPVDKDDFLKNFSPVLRNSRKFFHKK